jgi:hypothetical protein
LGAEGHRQRKLQVVFEGSVGLTNDERDHGGSISSGGFETLDQLLDLPDLNLQDMSC